MKPHRTSRLLGSAFSTLLVCATAACMWGCAHVPNQWVEDGPATKESWETPTSRDLTMKYQPAEQRRHLGEPLSVSAERGAVDHGPLYLEDPFADKGHGREGSNVYYIGWEDYVALPYCFARYTLNWLALPVSMVVTPPWTVMESDGEISKQILWYDHDAAPRAREQARREAPAPTKPEGGDAPETAPQS